MSLLACRRSTALLSRSLGQTSRAFAGKPEKKKVPPETPEQVTKRLKEQRDYWENQERSTIKTFLSQWGGLVWFGSFCGFAYINKLWGEWEMDMMDRKIEAEIKKKKRRGEAAAIEE